MMKYLEVNREIIDGEDGSLFSQLKRDGKKWSTKEHRRRQDDESLRGVAHRSNIGARAVDRAARSNVKSFGS
jgi:hypothetical protein